METDSVNVNNTNKKIKCRKCRVILTELSSTKLLNAHHEQYSVNSKDSCCPNLLNCTELYVNEDYLDPWIREEIEKSDWTKGKLKCIKCNSNVGSFDFITGQKCECRAFTQPAIHFIKSKIDVDTR